LVELGLESTIVGITTYDRYPPSIIGKSVIGGFLDVNTEAIVRAHPTAVFALVEGDESLRRVKSLGIPVDLLDHRSVKGILDSVTAIAQRCGISERGRTVVQQLKAKVAEVLSSHKLKDLSLKVLVVVGREVAAEGVSSVYVSGCDGFYHELLLLGGATNAYDGPTLSVPTLSAEGLRSLNPDLILEIVGTDALAPSDEVILESWQQLGSIPAVAQGRIFIMRNDYVTIPGPRYHLLLRDMVQVFSSVRR
jgi:iron complex transport system substrate-binding protein